MKIAVLIEPMNGNGFRATGGEPFHLSADGATRDEALTKLKEQVQARLNAGAEVVELDVGATEHPFLKYAGIFDPNDPWIQEWLKEVEEFRKQVDADLDRP